MTRGRAVWIDVLFKRHGAAHALRSSALLNLNRRLFRDEAVANRDGGPQLRRAGLEGLEAPGAEVVALALVVLSAVGRPEDLARVGPFRDHGDALVRKAARACAFQLRRGGRA